MVAAAIDFCYLYTPFPLTNTISKPWLPTLDVAAQVRTRQLSEFESLNPILR